jgi:hypothetical protein
MCTAGSLRSRTSFPAIPCPSRPSRHDRRRLGTPSAHGQGHSNRPAKWRNQQRIRDRFIAGLSVFLFALFLDYDFQVESWNSPQHMVG